jgi:hypothetical protein
MGTSFSQHANSSVTVNINLTKLQTIVLEDACTASADPLCDVACTITSAAYTVSASSTSPILFHVESKGVETHSNTRLMQGEPQAKRITTHKALENQLQNQSTPSSIHHLVINLNPPSSSREESLPPTKINDASQPKKTTEITYTMSVR